MRSKLTIFALLAVMLLATPLQALAQSQAQQGQPGVQVTDTQVVFSLGDITSNDFSLFSPLSASRLLFSVPPNWHLTSGKFTLQYDVLLTGSDLAGLQSGGGTFGGNLFVKLNNVIVATIPVNASGTFSQTIDLSADALTLVREDGRHIFTFTFDSQVSCVYDINAIVTIKKTSVVDVAYESTSPELNLARLPAPFYLESSIVPDGARVVVPDGATENEMQAALNVMAGLGSMIANTYDVQLVSLGDLTEADRGKYHLIFVGMPENLPLLSDVAFKMPVVNGKFSGLAASAQDDGILELALSPWNPMKAVMLVSGTTPLGILKAAHAFSSAHVLVFQDPQLANVSSVQLLSQDLPSVEDFTLSDLGYTTAASGVLSGFGVSSTEYVFTVAKNQVATRDGYIDLIYYHSGMLDYGTASFSMYLNGQIFSTIVFTKESEQVTEERVRIPPGLLRYGENRLEVRASMLQTPSCDQTLSTDPWLTISDQTNIHLPASDETTPVTSYVLRDLKFYPDLYVSSSDLGDVAFVMPKDMSDMWTLAGKLAYNLGETARPLISNLAVVYGDNVSDSLRNDYSMIVIGKATDQPFIETLNDQLPAPFDLANNTASERQLQISYRIPPGQNVGYLELLASPYNNENTILIVSGNTEAGASLASDALLQGALKDQLAGVFAVTNGTQIATGNALSPFSIVGEVVPGAEQVVTPLPTAGVTSTALERPSWLIPFMVATGVGILLVAFFVLIRFLRNSSQRRAADKKLASEESAETPSQP